MDIRISHNIGGSEYKVFEQKNGCDLCHKTGDEEQKVYYFKDGKGPFDKPHLTLRIGLNLLTTSTE